MQGSMPDATAARLIALPMPVRKIMLPASSIPSPTLRVSSCMLTDPAALGPQIFRLLEVL